jgi:hypothetical protein
MPGGRHAPVTASEPASILAARQLAAEAGAGRHAGRRRRAARPMTPIRPLPGPPEARAAES